MFRTPHLRHTLLRNTVRLSVAALVLAGCSGDDDATTEPTPVDSTVATTESTTTDTTTTISPTTISPTTISPTTTAAPATTAAPTTTVTPATTAAPADTTVPGTAPPDASTALAIEASFPADADVSVEFTELTDDHVVRRGGQSMIAQGQTFLASGDAGLTSVSFAVVPAQPLAADTPLVLTLYGIGDPVTSVPSEVIEIAGAPALELGLPSGLDTDQLRYLTFSFPAVGLIGGDLYAAVLSFGDGAPPGELFVQHSDGDVLADGATIWLEGSTWKADRTNDQAIALTFAG